MRKHREIDTTRERKIGYILLAIMTGIIVSGLSTLFISYNLGLFILENVSKDSLQAINEGVKLKYRFVQMVGGLEVYFILRAAILGLGILGGGGLLFFLHRRINRILDNYDELRAAIRDLVKNQS